MKYFKTILIAFTVSMFLGGPAMLYAADDTNSGFLPDYSRLKANPSHPDSKDWVNPEANLAQYNAIIIDPVTVHLSDALIKGGVRPDPDVLNKVTAYFHDALISAFKDKNWKIVDKAGNDAARYRAAITGITAEGGLDANPLHYVPAVFVLRAATGQDSTNAHIYMESYYTDSVTGQTLGEVTQAATGEAVSGNEITVDNLKGALDKWAKKAAEAFTAARDKK